MRLYFVFVIIFTFSLKWCFSAKILGIFPTATKSHYVMYGSIMRALAERGHSVTVATHFPEESPLENFTTINLSDTEKRPLVPLNYFLNMSYLDNVYDIIDFSLSSCELVLKQNNILNFTINKDYDLLIVEIFGSDCLLPVAYKLDIPSIGLISSAALPWSNDMIGFPENPAYIPVYFLPFTQKMNFFSRVLNTITTYYAKIFYEVVSNWKSHELAEDAFGPLPPLRALARNLSLILINSHLSVNHVRPWNLQAIEVGGLHIPKTIPNLSKDLKQMLDSAKDGVIFFSLGTIISPNSMSKEKFSNIISVLGALKQKVLWKIDSDELPKLPPNVITSTWFPQLAILCHPSTKAFISHGGLLGIQEAVYCGVPILGVPIFADQSMNLAGLVEKEAALSMKYNDINKESLEEALNRLLFEKRFREKCLQLSTIFKERPQHPLDVAIYWIEYVLRFRGAEHLRSPSHRLTWYQYLLLDVVLFLAVTLVVVLLTFLCITKILLNFLKMFCLKIAVYYQENDKKNK